jgi:hypothetical protein
MTRLYPASARTQRIVSPRADTNLLCYNIAHRMMGAFPTVSNFRHESKTRLSQPAGRPSVGLVRMCPAYLAISNRIMNMVVEIGANFARRSKLCERLKYGERPCWEVEVESRMLGGTFRDVLEGFCWEECSAHYLCTTYAPPR